MRSRTRAAAAAPPRAGPIDTIYGRFTAASKRRLDITFDYEAPEIAGFRRAAELIGPTLLSTSAPISASTPCTSPASPR